MFPESPLLPSIGQPFIILPQVDSTNNYAMGLAHEGMATHGTAVFTHHQTAGKGQRGKSWTSAPGQNLMITFILRPPVAARPFHLSAMIALACRDLILNYAKSEVSVKWPNDIYWRDRKTAGILVENKFQASSWNWCIAGIGMNLNQIEFDPGIKNPVSLKQICGRDFETISLAGELCRILEQRYQAFEPAGLLEEYNNSLYKKDQQVMLQSGSNTYLTTIRGVNNAGELITEDEIQRKFDQAVWIL